MFTRTESNLAVAEVDKMLPRLIEMSDWIGKHPELGSEEYEASKLLSAELEKNGFTVERRILGMDTAFRATFKGKPGGPCIAVLSEYDALPGVGHGCGHNIIGTAGVGAGIAISKLIGEMEGEVVVLGTPAEEGHGSSSGAKKRMVEGGVFADIDAAMMIHPTSDITTISTGFLAISGVNLVFKGKPSHAAASPEQGVNALNAAMITYMSVHANRQQLKRDANPVIHGIITEGGLASNITPDRAVMRFGVRSSDDTYVPELIMMVENCARGAALATGCEVEITTSPGLKSKIRNEAMEQLFYGIFRELGEKVEDPNVTVGKPPGGSTDFAEVTHVVPGIHPMVSIAPKEVAMHSYEMAEATFSETGHHGLEVGAKAMAVAGIEMLLDSELMAKIKAESAERLGQVAKSNS